ncbi:MAG: oligosaccharide flippase family protein [Akkermansiaceae bacterium]|jgi:O-antigen/teichoic acid export membrane protein|nr:oligosaccharide flippase family protein [Akkermansiaceae bacterium]MDP4721668.1 oligosaccharide flippase family protein [Akkermansiaceae bacterium]MDP4778840.1 oligosaccharide flippase family protein [Akkermansiaceae bacterium]MDP4846959.1 oligosaccharide flippase family protein [Akkermansiaceae bacterium]
MTKNLLARIRESPAFRTAITSYFLIGSVTVTSLVAVPVALGFLNAEEFGLWIFTKQALGYVLLLDFGVGAAVGRLMGGALADDEQKDRCFVTLSIVMLVQALVILVVGLLLLPYLLNWFEIPPYLKESVGQIWTISLLGSAAKHATRVIDGTLFAQNRVYWANLSGGVGTWVEFVIFLVLLNLGWGVQSYSWAFLASIACSILGVTIAFHIGPWRPVLKIKYFDFSMLRGLFNFSLKLFTLGAVAQVVFLSQSLIAAKLFGLTAAGSYSVCMRLTQLVRQIIARLYEAHIPGWQKLFLDNQLADLIGRWRYHLKFIVGVTLIGSISVSCWNSLFVTQWASPSLNVGSAFDFLAGAFLFANIWTGAMMAPLIFKMDLNARTYMALAQLLLTLVLCIFFANYIGLSGILLGALIGNLITVFWFNSWNGAKILGTKWELIWVSILRPNSPLLFGIIGCGTISLWGDFNTIGRITIWCCSALAFAFIHRGYIFELTKQRSPATSLKAS